MNVKNKVMYHYHTIDLYQDQWQVGNKLTIDDQFYSHYGKILQNFNTRVTTIDDQKVSFNRIIQNFLEKKDFHDQEYITKILTKASQIITNTNVFKREYALEEYRKHHCPDLPSRIHSIWVCEKEQLDFWRLQLGQHYQLELFQLSLTGQLFESNDLFIPDDQLTVQESLDQAQNYWHPEITKLTKEKSEFLFQGQVKILKKIPLPDVVQKQNPEY